MRRETDVFSVSSFLPRQAWKIARWLYVRGASSKLIGYAYKQIRAGADYNSEGVFLRLMGRSIRSKLMHDPDPVIVAHPSLVGILQGRPAVLYQHGETVAPGESLVRGAETVFVPTETVAESFRKVGYAADSVIVTGLCIEPALVRQAKDCFESRLARLASNEPLVGAFFSSGAEPRLHIERLVAAALSAAKRGGRVVLFCRAGGGFEQAARHALAAARLSTEHIDSSSGLPREMPQALIVLHRSRREENIFTGQLCPSFDYFVAPAHERSNWALGLGLPMFIIGPSIGPFAPLNRLNLLERRVAREFGSINNAREFGTTLKRLRYEGQLRKMALVGHGKFAIDGFDRIASWLSERYGT